MEIDGQQSFTSIWVNSSIIRFCASGTFNALDETNLYYKVRGKQTLSQSWCIHFIATDIKTSPTQT